MSRSGRTMESKHVVPERSRTFLMVSVPRCGEPPTGGADSGTSGE